MKSFKNIMLASLACIVIAPVAWGMLSEEELARVPVTITMVHPSLIQLKDVVEDGDEDAVAKLLTDGLDLSLVGWISPLLFPHDRLNEREMAAFRRRLAQDAPSEVRECFLGLDCLDRPEREMLLIGSPLQLRGWFPLHALTSRLDNGNGYDDRGVRKRIMELLLDAGVDPNLKHEFGTPLHDACGGIHTQHIIQLLLDHGADMELISEGHKKPIHLTVITKRGPWGLCYPYQDESDADNLHLLLEHGACMAERLNRYKDSGVPRSARMSSEPALEAGHLADWATG